MRAKLSTILRAGRRNRAREVVRFQLDAALKGSGKGVIENIEIACDPLSDWCRTGYDTGEYATSTLCASGFKELLRQFYLKELRCVCFAAAASMRRMLRR